MANTYLASQFSGPVVQAVVQGIQNAVQEPLTLVQYWSLLSIATAQDVDGTLDYVGQLVGYPRPLVTNLFTTQFLLLFSDANLPQVDSIPYGLGDALGIDRGDCETTGPNLIDRGDCESATPPMVSGETVPQAPVNCTWARDGGQAHSGSYSYLQLSSGAGTMYAYLVSNIDSNNLHGFIPGHTYTLPLYVYPTVGGWTLSSIVFSVAFYHNGGWDYSWNSNSPSSTGAWNLLTNTFTVPANATGAQVFFKAVAGGASWGIYVDDITLVDESLIAPMVSGETVPFGPANGTYAQSGAQHHGGSFSWLLTKTSIVGGGSAEAGLTSSQLATNLHGFTPGHTYSLPFYGYVDNGIAANKAGIEIAISTDGVTFSIFTDALISATGAWTPATLTFTLPAGATGVSLYSFIFTDQPQNGRLYVDDITLVDSAGGEFDTALPSAGNVMPATWYQQLLPIYAEANYSGLSIETVDALAAWANTNGGGTGYTIAWDKYDNVSVVFTTYVDPRYLYICNSVVAKLETLPLVVFQEP